MVKSSAGNARVASRLSATRGGRDFTARPQPGWAKGLQQLYDDVVDEALPPEFADLLSQLDQKSDEA